MAGIEAQQHLPPFHSCATLRARHVDEDDVWTLELTGEADIATLSMLTEELAEGLRVDRPRFVIDIAGLRFCDVRSAELMMSVTRAASVSLRGVAGSVKRVFDLLASEGSPPPWQPPDVVDRPPLKGSW